MILIPCTCIDVEFFFEREREKEQPHLYYKHIEDCGGLPKLSRSVEWAEHCETENMNKYEQAPIWEE